MDDREETLGEIGERKAAAYLENRGYVILSRNYRVGRNEIDLIALEQDVLVFVEVKTRRSLRYGHPVFSVTPAKMRNIRKVARIFFERENLSVRGVRFDVVTILIRGSETCIEHTRDAFRSE